jgi:hypothetical protein
LPLDPRFPGSNTAEVDGFLIAITSVARLPSERKQSRRHHAIRFYGMLKNPTQNERAVSSAKFTAISRQVSPDMVLGVSSGTCQRALVYESVITGTWGCTIERKIVAIHGTLWTIPPHIIN